MRRRRIKVRITGETTVWGPKVILETISDGVMDEMKRDSQAIRRKCEELSNE